MDKFIWRFKRGTTEFERSSDDSSSVPRKALGLYEIQEQSSYSGSYNFDSGDLLQYTGCGWPKHLLVPRGNPSGFKTNLLVVISPLLDNDDAANTDWRTVSTLTHSLCGAPGEKFPDSRPMGYPFDRYQGWRSVIQGRSNMKRTQITIYHQKDCSSSRDCPSGQYCDTFDKRCNLGSNPDSEATNQPLFTKQPKRYKVDIRTEKLTCPIVDGSIPKLNQKIFKGVRKEIDCETRCKKTQECAYYEWHKVDGSNDYCMLYEHLVLQSGHSNSVSGLKTCNSFQPLFEGKSCYLRDTRPVMQQIQVKSSSTSEQCKALCSKNSEVSIFKRDKNRNIQTVSLISV